MKIMQNQPNPQPVALVIETIDAILAALRDSKNVVTVTLHPNDANVWRTVVVVVRGEVFTLRFFGELEAWEAVGPRGDRYIVTDADAAPMSLAVDAIMGLRD